MRLNRSGGRRAATLLVAIVAVAVPAAFGSRPASAAGQLPPLDPHVFYVDENLPADALVATLPAADGDGDPVTYTVAVAERLNRVVLVGNELRTTRTLDRESGEGWAMEIWIDASNGASTQRSKVTVYVADVVDTLPHSVLQEPVLERPGQLEVRWYVDDGGWLNSRPEQFTVTWPGGSAVVPIGAWNENHYSYVIRDLPPGPMSVTLTSSNSFGSTSVAGKYTIGGDAAWPAAFTSLTPARLLDTRPGAAIGHSGAKPSAGDVLELQVTGRESVPADAVAVALNVTATDATESGYVSVFPAGGTPPNVSSVNVEAGATAANSAIVRVGRDGKVALYTERGTHLIVDIAGYWTTVPRPEHATYGVSGRMYPMPPKRALDTRRGTTGPVPAGGTVTVNPQMLGIGVDASFASAVILNVTATDAAAPGYVTVWAAETERPNASNLNLAAPGQTVANQVIVPVTHRGVTLYSEAGTHLIVDVVGYFSKLNGSTDDLGGLFVPVEPFRQFDTRTDPAGKLTPDQQISFTEAAQLPADMPTGRIAAFALNMTATAPDGPGFVAVYPCATGFAGTSTLNLDRAGQTVPNAATGSAAEVCVGTSVTTHLIADVFGYYLER